jgi:hypothetical protein
MRRKFVSAAAALALATFGVVAGGSAPAQAACSGYIEFYDNSNGTTLLESTCADIVQRSRCYQVATYTNNHTSYIRNTSGAQFFVHDNSSCSGSQGVIWPHSQGAMNSTWNNNISSYWKA